MCMGAKGCNGEVERCQGVKEDRWGVKERCCVAM